MKKYVIGAVAMAAAAIILIRAQEPQAPAPALMFRAQVSAASQPAVQQPPAPAPTDALALMKAGDAAVHARQFAQADLYYAQAVALGDRPEIAPALLYLGVKAYGTANYLAAEGFLERLIALSPNGPLAGQALTWMGAIRERDPNTFAEAETLYQKALTVEDPKSLDTVDTLRRYATLLGHVGRPDEAAAMEAREREAATAVHGTKKANPQALPAGVYRMSDGITAPKLVSKVEPQYTEEARAGAIEGTTVLSVEIGPDGIARNIQVTRSLEPGLDQKAIDAVTEWRFQPGEKDGAAVTVAATIEVNFRLK